jgi:hypothetical protein
MTKYPDGNSAAAEGNARAAGRMGLDRVTLIISSLRPFTFLSNRHAGIATVVGGALVPVHRDSDFDRAGVRLRCDAAPVIVACRLDRAVAHDRSFIGPDWLCMLLVPVDVVPVSSIGRGGCNGRDESG